MNRENAIEWLTGQNIITVSLTQKRFITRVLKLAEDPSNDVEIVAKNEDGSICAHLPLRALHLTFYNKNRVGFAGVCDLPEEDETDED